MKIFERALLFAFALLLMSPCQAFAAQDEVPMEITSNSMRYDQAQSMVVFEGDVHAIREEMDIRARTVTVHLKKTAEGETAAAENDIEKIVAEGDVRITQGDRTGSSSRATYYADRGLLVMKGDPVLQEGKNRISGRVVRLYLRENRSEIEGGGDKRVEALFFTPRDIEGGDQEKQ